MVESGNNVTFARRIPVNQVFRGELRLYLIEFVEFKEVMACRYLLTRRSSLDGLLAPCDLQDPKSPAHFDGRRLWALRRAKTISGGRTIPLMHGDYVLCTYCALCS